MFTKQLLEILKFTGSFGQVFYGLLTNEADQSIVEVAVKTIKGTNHHS